MTSMRVYTDTNLTPEPWMASGACLEAAPDDFFPTHGDAPTAARARRICGGCAVRDECLTYALDHREVFGVWGGTVERERRRILKGRTT